MWGDVHQASVNTAQQALTTADTLSRLQKYARRYMDALKEIAVIGALVQVGAAHAPPGVLQARPSSAHLSWWNGPLHNMALLTGCLEAGYIPAGYPRRSVVRD